VEALLKRIPQLMIAEAAFRCGAFARALKCVEQHVREAPPDQDKAVIERVASFLQKICGGLDDSDGLEGLTKLRRSQTPREQILDLEHRGQWAYALDWYDAALRNDAHASVNGPLVCCTIRFLVTRLGRCPQELRLGQLRCMLHLGHFETMLAVVRSGKVDASLSILFVQLVPLYNAFQRRGACAFWIAVRTSTKAAPAAS
jgi:hypothetical protein